MMRTKSCLLVLTLLIVSVAAQAQHEETVLGDRNFGFSGIWGGSKHQLTRFGSTNSYVSNWHFGLEFGKALNIGMGGYYLNEDVRWDQIQNQSFDMRYRTLNLGYGFQSYRAIHPTIAIDAGPGFVRLDDTRDNIFVVQPAAGVEINVFRWFHLGLEGGYRFVTDSSLPGLSDDNLSGAFAQATLKFGFSWGRYRKGDRDRDHDRHRDRDDD